MKLIKGKKIADKILIDLKRKIKKEEVKPGLAVILVGKNKASETYVGLKRKAAERVGINFYLFRFNEKAKEGGIVKKIKELNRDEKINGIIVQLPLPKKFNQQKIINAIESEKDADGFSRKSLILPVFPRAIMQLIESSREKLQNKQAVIIVNSDKFGKVMKMALQKKGINGKYILYKNFKKHANAIKQADIIISAVGAPEFIKGEMIKEGAVVIDGGIIKKGKKVLGDVNFESVKNIDGYLSPVPGGVGPVTVACLLENAYLLMKKQG